MTSLRSARPRALFVAPTMPADGGNGLAMRAGLFLEGLARSHDVRVLVVPVFGTPPPPGAFVDRLACAVEVLAIDRAPDPVADLVARLATPEGRGRANALHPRPTLSRSATAAATEAVALAAGGVDLVHVMRLYLAPFLDDVLDLHRRPRCVIDVDDVESRTRRRLGQGEEARRYARMEAHYLRRFDAVLTCSSADSDELAGRLGLANAAVVPNAVRSPPGPLVATPPRGRNLVFVATFGYGPNIDGARWLCHEVLPRLHDATVTLVGRQPSAEVRALAGDGRVLVTGTVPDVAPWYAGAGAAVVPVGPGGGSRIKLLEAFAHRRPVVATSAGAEGLAAGEMDALAVVDDPQGFATACQRLLDDPGSAERMVRRADSVLAASYTVEVVARHIDGLLTATPTQRRGSG